MNLQKSWDSVKCRRIQKRLNSISDFMGRFLRESSLILNLERGGWSGHFWREHFKSICLEDGVALSTCLKYIEQNPVRAKMVNDPANYKWSSWGERAVKGKRGGCNHPYKERIIASLRHIYDISSEQMSDEKVWAIYARDLTILAELSNSTEAQLIEALSEEVYEEIFKPNPRLMSSQKLSLGRRPRLVLY